MLTVKPAQIWKVYAWDEKRWRQAVVVSVLRAPEDEHRNVVTLQYLDAPELARSFQVDLGRMERVPPQFYRFVRAGAY